MDRIIGNGWRQRLRYADIFTPGKTYLVLYGYKDSLKVYHYRRVTRAWEGVLSTAWYLFCYSLILDGKFWYSNSFASAGSPIGISYILRDNQKPSTLFYLILDR